MHEGRRSSCISFYLNAGRVGGAGRGYSSAEGRNGKDFGHWTRGWNRQVARGGGLRYTRAKDLV